MVLVEQVLERVLALHLIVCFNHGIEHHFQTIKRDA
jgi:hypothetical protein